MNDSFTAQPELTALPGLLKSGNGADQFNAQGAAISLAETIAELRFQENVYQSALEVSRRTLAVLSMFNHT